MGLYEYMILSENDQWLDLWDNCTFLTHRIDKDFKYSLYALYGFFVEVKQARVTNRILSKAHFKTGDLLDRYAGSIDINKV